VANPEQTAILKKGVDERNQWRNEHPEINPDLSKANLREADLRRAICAGGIGQPTNLCGAHLEFAILVETKLEEANLSDCRIYGISAWDVRCRGFDYRAKGGREGRN